MENTFNDLLRTCSSNQARRLQRINTEEFYLLSFETQNTSNVNSVFKIAGSTQNVYTIKLYKNNTFFCDCLDSKSHCQTLGCVCKHICFIVCKIGKIFDSTFFIERKLTNEQVELLINKLQFTHEDIVDEELVIKFSKLLNDKKETAELFKKRREILPEDECSVCYDSLTNNKHIVACPTCKNWFH